MSILSQFGKSVAKQLALTVLGGSRSSLENPSTTLSFPAEWLVDAWTGNRSDSGIRVSEITALQVSTVFACVNRIATSVATLPLNVYEHLAAKDLRASKRLAFDHDLFDLLHYGPNPEMTSRTWRIAIQAHMLLWGNGYSEIQRDKAMRPVAVWPRNPAKIRPVRVSNAIVYKTTEGEGASDPTAQDGSERIIEADNVLHIPGLTIDGRIGLAAVQLARQVLGLALASEKFGNKLFANYGRPGGVLLHPGQLSPEARENIKDTWQQAQSGENSHKVALLEEGLQWKDVSNKPNEAQFLETRQFQRAEICSIFGVPPHMIGDPDKQNRANTEQLGLEFVTFTLQPWLVAWEQELKRKLFPNRGRNANKFFAMFDPRRLTMPDATSRKGFYIAGKQWGFLSTNDIREMEHLNPIDDDDADALWIPLNMAKAGAQSNIQDDEDISGRSLKAFKRVFRDAFGRIVERRDPDSAAFKRAFLPVLLSIADLISRSTDDDEAEIEPAFLVSYIEEMRGRLPEWKKANGEADLVADSELGRAAKALRTEILRTIEERREAEQ